MLSIFVPFVVGVVLGGVTVALVYHNNQKQANALIATYQAKLVAAGVKV